MCIKINLRIRNKPISILYFVVENKHAMQGVILNIIDLKRGMGCIPEPDSGLFYFMADTLLFKTIQHLNGKAGIYKLTINSKFYVGSSINLYKRLYSHIIALRNGRHCNPRLQNAYKKYKNITYEIIEFVDDHDILLDREQWYLNDLRPRYNLCAIAHSALPRKKKQTERVVKRRKGRNTRPGIIYDMKTGDTFIFQRLSETCRGLGICYNSFRYAVNRNVLYKKRFSFEYIPSIPRDQKTVISHTIRQLDALREKIVNDKIESIRNQWTINPPIQTNVAA